MAELKRSINLPLLVLYGLGTIVGGGIYALLGKVAGQAGMSTPFAVGLTGLALTKLDGTAKGGIVVNISHELQIPIRFIGIGEKIDDLRDFAPDEFIEALFGENGVAA